VPALSKLDLPANDSWVFHVAFSVVGLSVWNSLPDYLHDPAVGRDTFRQHLKTFYVRFLQRIRGLKFTYSVNVRLH